MTNEAVVVVEKAANYPRGQRPGLDRKRPRFSMRPDIRQSTANFELTLDFDKLKDPEEFFSAYERLENAKKEISKQTGRAVTDSDQHNVFNVPRSQRPGIEGRSRMAKYQHLYPIMPSHETSEMNILSTSNSQQDIASFSSQQTQAMNAASQDFKSTNDSSQQTESGSEMELTGSLVKVENRVNKLLDDLLAAEELEGDGAFNLLQDMLQIKPLQVEKLNLVALQDIQRSDFKYSAMNLSIPKNISLDINNLLRGIRSKTPTKLKNGESSWLKLNQSNHPFPAADIDQSPTRNVSHDENFNKHSDPVNVENASCIFGDLNAKTNEDKADGVGGKSSNKMAVEDFTSLFSKHVDENIKRLSTGCEIGSRESVTMLDNNNVVMDNGAINENLSQANAYAGLQENRPNDSPDMAGDAWNEAMTSAQLDQETVEFPEEMSNSNRNNHDSVMAESQATDGCLGYLDSAQEQNQNTAREQIIQELSTTSINERTKAKSRPNKERKRKAVSGRQSLAGCGMSWESGVRRSTRIKSRPLEYWKGEKFLYGRIHGSLATVIGIKCASPEKNNGSPTLKVKSFVSDEYRGLVEQAALY